MEEEEFKQGLTLFHELDSTSAPSNSKEYQNMVRNAIAYFGSVSQLVEKNAVFSANEELDDIATESLKYDNIRVFLPKMRVQTTGI